MQVYDIIAKQETNETRTEECGVVGWFVNTRRTWFACCGCSTPCAVGGRVHTRRTAAPRPPSGGPVGRPFRGLGPGLPGTQRGRPERRPGTRPTPARAATPSRGTSASPWGGTPGPPPPRSTCRRVRTPGPTPPVSPLDARRPGCWGGYSPGCPAGEPPWHNPEAPHGHNRVVPGPWSVDPHWHNRVVPGPRSVDPHWHNRVVPGRRSVDPRLSRTTLGFHHRCCVKTPGCL